MAKRGRKPNYVRDENGVEVHGLSRVECRKDPLGNPVYRYFTTARVDGKPKQIGFGSDPAIAVMRFRDWEARQRGASRQIFKVDPTRVIPLLRERGYAGNADEIAVLIDDEAFWQRVRRLFMAPGGRKLFAERLNVPEIEYVTALKPPEPSLRLAEISEWYLKRNRPSFERWARDIERFWDQFCEVVGGRDKTLREITREDIDRYHGLIDGQFRAGGVSRTYVKHRFLQIRGFLKYAKLIGRDQPEIDRVLDLCAILKPPKKRDAKRYGKKPKTPSPIEPKHFRALLRVADTKWRAVYLLSLNCLMYPSEVLSVRKDEIDLRSKTFVSERSKTGVLRVGVLWDRTVQAIREYQKTAKHQSEFLFVTFMGKRYAHNNAARMFRIHRKEAGIPETVCFEHLRDGGYTKAIEMGASADLARLIAGHKVAGMTDEYLRRNPRMVAPAARAIEKCYFG